VFCLLKAVEKWLPDVEEKLKQARPIAADARNVRIQIEELKVDLSLHYNQMLFLIPSIN